MIYIGLIGLIVICIPPFLFSQQYYLFSNYIKLGIEVVIDTRFFWLIGSERDYVILSLVRSLPEREIERNPSRSWLKEHLGFLTDEHQINVALTRAKRGLCIIGKFGFFGNGINCSSNFHNYILQYILN